MFLGVIRSGFGLVVGMVAMNTHPFDSISHIINQVRETQQTSLALSVFFSSPVFPERHVGALLLQSFIYRCVSACVAKARDLEK